MCWQRKWPDQSHGTLVLQLKTILCALRQKNIILFKVGGHARNRNTAIYHPSQSITCSLTTTKFCAAPIRMKAASTALRQLACTCWDALNVTFGIWPATCGNGRQTFMKRTVNGWRCAAARGATLGISRAWLPASTFVRTAVVTATGFVCCLPLPGDVLFSVFCFLRSVCPPAVRREIFKKSGGL